MRRNSWSCLLLWFASLGAHAAPHLVTPNLPSAAVGVPYSASLLVGSPTPLGNVTVSGLPVGLTPTHNGSGSVAIAGTPAQIGAFTVSVNATDVAGGVLNTTVTLSISRRSTTATAVSVGGAHACAVVGGGVQCWGFNVSGQLGNNSTTDSSIPVQAIPPGSNATAVSAGFYHACAVVDGGVKCWGSNSSGQLGDGKASGSRSLVPVQAIAAGSGATAVSAGTGHSCAVVANALKCWGDNTYGQLGNNSTSPSTVPVQVIMPAGSVATAVAAGDEHSCAAVDGSALCWGRNLSGQLGNGTTSTSHVGVYAIFDKGVRAVSAGNAFSCAVAEDGVQCWGSNSSGQLGNNTTARSLYAVQSVPAYSNATAVASGRGHTCAVVNGGVQCWGANWSAQLGRGDQGGAPSLTPVQIIPSGSNVTAVGSGYGTTCAVMSGEVRCWGDASRGALGNGLAGATPVPVQAVPSAAAVAVTAGYEHSCAVVSGGVKCWGYNDSGEVGDNTLVDRLVPTTAIAAGSNATEVSGGTDHTCAVVAGGVLCWGDNNYGRLGTGNTTASRVPVQVLALGPGAGVTQVSAGDEHTCAVAHGGVLCWGYGGDGQLGTGGTEDSYSPVLTIALGAGATAVSAGDSHTCAVVAGGARCWGYNYYGQLGDNSGSDRFTPAVAIADGSNVTAISAGVDHTCAVVAGGVQCWGSNGNGQLGNNSKTQSLKPVQAIAAGSNATAVSAGTLHSCAVVAGGVQCWGANGDGQLGNNTRTDSLIPVQAIPAGSNATAVEVGDAHSCAVVSGAVVCWGDGYYAELGNAAYESAVRPAPVLFLAEPTTTASLTITKTGVGSGTVTSLPAGINCGATCSAGFVTGSLVVLTATPSPDSIFAGWSGACSGLYGCSVSMDAAKSVTANFMPNPTPTLAVTKAGSGTGTVTSVPAGIDCGVNCSNTFSRGSVVVLNATAATGNTFTGWSGGGCSGTGSCSVTMDAAKTVTATFVLGSDPPRLANISTRMQVLTGGEVMIGGFVIGGSARKTVVVRARGPSLTQYGVQGALANPLLQLVSGTTQIAANDDYETASNLAQLKASGFAPSHPQEAAILIQLDPGAYTAIVSGVGGAVGVAIVEVFEVDAVNAPLINISSRGKVQTGDNVMIAGFIIQGSGPQTVVVRARGPSLAPYGIPNPLANPVMQLFRGTTPIATNDDWQQVSNAAQIQASGFAPSDTREAAIMMTLEPGAYSAIVTGAGGTTGVGIVEVFKN